MGIVNYKEHTMISDCCERLARAFYQGRIGRHRGEVKIVGGRVPEPRPVRQNEGERGFARGSVPNDYSCTLISQCSLDRREQGRGVDAVFFILLNCRENPRGSTEVDAPYDVFDATKRAYRACPARTFTLSSERIFAPGCASPSMPGSGSTTSS